MLSKNLFLWYRNCGVNIQYHVRLLQNSSELRTRQKTRRRKNFNPRVSFTSSAWLTRVQQKYFFELIFSWLVLRWAYIWARPTLARGSALVENWSLITLFASVLLVFLSCSIFCLSDLLANARDKKTHAEALILLTATPLTYSNQATVNCSRRRQLKTERKSITSVID